MGAMLKTSREVIRRSVRLSKLVHIAVYVVGLGLWTSGCLWLWLDRFVVHAGEFGPEKHPLEAWSLKVHGGLAVMGVWLFGLLWGLHIQPAWPLHRRRLSGSVLAAWLGLVVLSGYLLYYVGGEESRRIVSLFHWIAGVFLPLLFLLHRVRRRRKLHVR